MRNTPLQRGEFVESVYMSEKEFSRHGEFNFNDGKIINMFHGTALTFDGDWGVSMEEESDNIDQQWEVVAAQGKVLDKLKFLTMSLPVPLK